jgi:hypothetical protein
METYLKIQKIISYLNVSNIHDSHDLQCFLAVLSIAIITTILFLEILKSYLKEIRKGRSSYGWLPTNALILSSSVKSNIISDEIHFWPEIEYRYNVNGNMYLSDNIPYYLIDKFNLHFNERITERFPEGSRTEIYYNSRNHKEAILLFRGHLPIFLNYLLIWVFCIFGFFMAAGILTHFALGWLGIIIMSSFLYLYFRDKLKTKK